MTFEAKQRFVSALGFVQLLPLRSFSKILVDLVEFPHDEEQDSSGFSRRWPLDEGKCFQRDGCIVGLMKTRSTPEADEYWLQG